MSSMITDRPTHATTRVQSSRQTTVDLQEDLKALAAAGDNEPSTPTTTRLLYPLWNGECDGFSDFLKAVARFPLLREKEFETAVAAQEYVAFLGTLDAARVQLQADRPTEPTDADVLAAAGYSTVDAQRLRTVGKHAAQKMVNCNLRLVVTVAKKYPSPLVSIEDRVQAGALGLMRAVEKFDPHKGYKFSTYAYWWIRQAITRTLAEQSRTVRLPLYVIEKLRRINKATKSLAENLQRTPTEAEIADACELSVAALRDLRQHYQPILSLNHLVGDQDNGTETLDLTPDTESQTEAATTVDHSLLAASLEALLAELSPQARNVIRWRYGLVDGQQYTYAEIGAKLNLSRERVRQIAQKALRWLRKQKGSLSDFL